MNQLATLMKAQAARNLAIGLGVVIVVPVAVNLLGPVVRPLARGALKVGILAFEKGRETVAEIGEVIDDLVAEVQEELQDARREQTAALDVDSSETPGRALKGGTP